MPHRPHPKMFSKVGLVISTASGAGAKKVTKAFSHMFNLEVFYVAEIDGEVAGITACTDRRVPSVFIKSKDTIYVKANHYLIRVSY